MRPASLKKNLRRMIALAMSTGLAFTASHAAVGDDVPFASPGRPAPGQPDTSNLTSLADIMGVTQLRHIKLWYAGRAGNWQLTKYELAGLAKAWFEQRCCTRIFLLNM